MAALFIVKSFGALYLFPSTVPSFALVEIRDLTPTLFLSTRYKGYK